MNTDYKFTKFSSPFLDSLTELLDSSFTIKNQDKTGLVQWKLFDPYLKNNTISYIALNSDNKVVSQYSNVPITLRFNNTFYKAMVCIDMATDKGHRGKKLISTLSQYVYDEVVKQGYALSIGFSNDAGVKVDKNASHYGYKVVGKFVRYSTIAIPQRKSELKALEISLFPSSLEPNLFPNIFSMNKTSDYLNWRYVKRPNSVYRIFQLTQKDHLLGFVVLRFIGKKCYVYDILLLTPLKSDLLKVLRSIEKIALLNKAIFVIYNVLDNTFWKKALNAFRYYKKTDNQVNYYLTVKIHNPNIDQGTLLNKENWLMMNGDII